MDPRKAPRSVAYTNVFWGGRSEIKPSETSPLACEVWCGEMELKA